MREKIKRYIGWCEKTADSNTLEVIYEKTGAWCFGILILFAFWLSARSTWHYFDFRYPVSPDRFGFAFLSLGERILWGSFSLTIALATGGFIVLILWMYLKSPLESLKKRFKEWRKPKPVRLTLHDVDNLTGNRATRRHPPR